MPNMRTIF